MESNDVIDFQPEIIKVVTDEETGKYFEDENLLLVLKLLRKGAMTVDDLVQEFKKQDVEKSDKTIYRYLNKLTQADLVAKAGKRVLKKGDDYTTQTLYSRTAKVFFENYSEEEKQKPQHRKPKKLFDVCRLLIGQLYGESKGDPECFNQFAKQIQKEQKELIIDLFQNAGEEVYKKITDFDWDSMNFVMEFVSWVALSQKMNFREKLHECYGTGD
ncbi:MAG: ArsR family transcriptional regulator [Candidatus Heimdallarchaeota archaeon]|nr:ArsR family transcriptional regulator [Candidatus Heimdallarchaeota archaeon]